MDTIYPCPICHTKFKLPLDRGLLNVQCPSCGYQFTFDPIELLSKTPNYEIPIQSKTLLNQRLRIIQFLLFFILGLYIFREFYTCQDIKIYESPEDEKLLEPLEPIPPFEEEEEIEQEAPFSI